MKYVAIAGAALILVIAGVLYFSQQATQPQAPAKTTSTGFADLSACAIESAGL